LTQYLYFLFINLRLIAELEGDGCVEHGLKITLYFTGAGNKQVLKVYFQG